MTDGAQSGPPPAVEAQDPLPEGNWFYRRIFVGVLTAVLCIGVYFFAVKLAGSESADQTQAFLSLAKWTLLLLWFISTYYLVAPSAEQVTRMWQTANVLKSGVTMSKQNIATAPDGSAASSTATAGVGGNTGQPLAGVLPPSTETGLPEIHQDFTGPPLGDIPRANPDLPEEAPWKP
jgi:hypothetical protein